MRTKFGLQSYREQTACIKGAPHPTIPENPSQDPLRDAAERLLQIHKTYVNWLRKLPRALEDPAEGVELVHCSTSRTKKTLLLLDLRCDHPADPESDDTATKSIIQLRPNMSGQLYA